MMDFILNLTSIEWWDNLLSQLTFAEFEARWAMIQQALANPQQHPLIAMLALAIILVFILIVILTIAMIYFGRVQKQNEEYELLDEDENVVRTVDKKTAEALLDQAEGIDTSSKINYAGILVALVAILFATLGLGFSTRTEVFCTVCHSSPHAELEEWSLVAAHEELTCVNCHEPGNALQGVTLNLFPRAAHSIYGVFVDINDPDASNATAYGRVTQASCEGCHSRDSLLRTLVVHRPDKVNVRVSHLEPLEAGMSCTQCHLFSENQEAQLIQTGMQTCVSCHNGSRASIACVSCHLADSPADTIHRDMTTQFWSRQLIFDRPDASCYDCHDTRSCDACHGTRVPHTPAYMMHVHAPNGEMIHAYDYWRIGDMCYNCHFYGNASAAGPCSACHGLDFMPPEPRYLTPRQQYLQRQQDIELERTIREQQGLLDEDAEQDIDDQTALPPVRQGGTGNPFSPTPRRSLTPAQQQLLRDNNIDLSLP